MKPSLSERASLSQLLDYPDEFIDNAEYCRASLGSQAEFTSSKNDIVVPGESLQDLDSTAASLLRLNHVLSEKPAASNTGLGGATGRHFKLTALSRASYRYGKRVVDILFAFTLLVVLSPILLLCAIAIRAQSKGPVLFRQRRIGKGGQQFTIFKFRTMIPNAEAVLQHVLATDPKARAEWEADRKLRKDPRITGLGRFLRRTSLDELPQFWNVLIGDMSVVGPRPIVAAEISIYREAYRLYCAVRPGITGLWQVSGRNDTGYVKRVLLDCEYVISWSTIRDLNIVFRTIKVMVDGLGAY